MKAFTALYQSLDATTKTKQKVAAMTAYFAGRDPGDAAWAVFFLSGQRLRRLIPFGMLRQACSQAADVGEWMVEECHDAVGDLAETIALLLPENETASTGSLSRWIEERIRPLANMDEHQRRQSLISAWSELPTGERFVFNKLVTGAFRVGVSHRLVVRALAETANVDKATIVHRLMGNWQPTAEAYQALIATDAGQTDYSRPYPFCLAHPLQAAPDSLGDRADWVVEWKWDGIRGQIIRRRGESFLWSRGEELVHERFPELHEPMQQLPNGVVLDGEVLGWKDGVVLPFSELQRRIGRKSVGRKMLAEVPVRFVAFDLLEEQGDDIRQRPLADRRHRLQALLENRSTDFPIQISDVVNASTWDQLSALRETSRQRNVEGFMLKRADSPYSVGRVTGLWWKWKVDPYTCDAVLIYAQRGTGRRASLYTDYTFAVWQAGNLVPFAKAYSGLTDEEIREVDSYVRRHTVERFGPVRSVKPELVFELAFENIQESKRHKSGIAVRFPRIVRWRKDKRIADADTLEHVKSMMPE